MSARVAARSARESGRAGGRASPARDCDDPDPPQRDGQRDPRVRDHGAPRAAHLLGLVRVVEDDDRAGRQVGEDGDRSGGPSPPRCARRRGTRNRPARGGSRTPGSVSSMYAGNVLDPLGEAELAEPALGDPAGRVDVERHQAPIAVQLERRALVGAGEAEAGAELEAASAARARAPGASASGPRRAGCWPSGRRARPARARWRRPDRAAARRCRRPRSRAGDPGRTACSPRPSRTGSRSAAPRSARSTRARRRAAAASDGVEHAPRSRRPAGASGRRRAAPARAITAR